jgi:very-short-patch-repair endonuclease
MSVREVLVELGGLSTRADLVLRTSRAAVDRAVRHGEVVVGAPGRYALPEVDDAARLAHELSGVLCLTSAALHHGWEVKQAPDRPDVLLPRHRKVSADRRALIRLHRGDLHPDQVDGVATSAATTLEMCLRSLQPDEALCVGDSFLRHGGYPGVLRGIAASARGPGSVQVRRVAAEARGEAANPFESVLRAIALDVPGLHVRPQVTISSPVVWARPDLVDTDLRVILEADSFAWHGDRAALHRDARRYNRLVVDGWRVLRFSWEQVMFHPDEVRETLLLLVTERTQGPLSLRVAA